MKILKYAFLVNFVLICIPYHSFAVDTDQSNIAAIEQRAEAGDLKAQLTLAGMYYTGNGVSQDYSQALKYFTLAANQGNEAAKMNINLIKTSTLSRPNLFNENSNK